MYLTLSGWSFAEAWIIVSITLFVITGVTVATILDPRAKRLVAAAAAAPDGPLGQDLAGELDSPRARIAERMLIGTDLAIVFLMTNKPGWAGAIAVGAAGVALGAVLAGLGHRRAQAPDLRTT